MKLINLETLKEIRIGDEVMNFMGTVKKVIGLDPHIGDSGCVYTEGCIYTEGCRYRPSAFNCVFMEDSFHAR